MNRTTDIIRRPSPYLLLILTALFWAVNIVLARGVRLAVPPIGLSFWRWVLALLIVLPFSGPHLRKQWRLLRHSWKILLVLGILGVTNFNTFLYIGLQSTMATNAVLIMSTIPVVIVALSRFLLKQRVTPRQVVGILISLLGVMTIVTRGDVTSLLKLQLAVGDVWILVAVLNWAFYSVFLKWRPTELHPMGFLGATIFLGVLVLVPVYSWELSTGARMHTDFVTLGSVIYVALFPSVLAYIFWNRAVAEVGANRSGLFIHLVPAFGTLLSMFFLGEVLYAFHSVGIVLIFSGIYLTTAGSSVATAPTA